MAKPLRLPGAPQELRLRPELLRMPPMLACEPTSYWAAGHGPMSPKKLLPPQQPRKPNESSPVKRGSLLRTPKLPKPPIWPRVGSGVGEEPGVYGAAGLASLQLEGGCALLTGGVDGRAIDSLGLARAPWWGRIGLGDGTTSLYAGGSYSSD
jgi:hypothetical protein